jgi:rare lipoprotein A (peptidoglycan hydrolase)
MMTFVWREVSNISLDFHCNQQTNYGLTDEQGSDQPQLIGDTSPKMAWSGPWWLAMGAAAFLVAAICLFISQPNVAQTGRASWYARTSLTASGERCNPQALTAAHRTLAFGSRVKVENLKNGPTCSGPHQRPRSDITRSNYRRNAGGSNPARFPEAGTAQVRLRVP